jgi:CMP-N-acetylneuraminic acid synthetase
MTNIVALVPMRHHSQRVPGKNYRPLAGKPLFHHIITSLQICPEITQIVVDTDSIAIIHDLQEHFPKVIILERPARLRADDIATNEVLIYDISQVQADFYLQTHSTNPLLRSETISKAVQTFISNYPVYDSLFSVTRMQTRLWDQLGKAINHDPAILLQTQDLPPVYEENSCLYIFKSQTLLAHRNRLGERPMMFEIDPPEAWDIDEELDFQIVELLMTQGKEDIG